MASGSRVLRHLEVVAAAAVLAMLATVFWKLRLYDSGTKPISFAAVDLYTELIPTVHYGLTTLRAGAFPLWNPYQLCGVPYLAIGWTGILYPPTWIGLVLDPLVTVEVLLVWHFFWASFGMWLLCRHLGLGTLAGFCASTTFMWTGWIVGNTGQPPVIAAISWMPWIVLALDRVLLGRRRAWLGFAGALAAQCLVGMVELVVHTAYLTALFAFCRSVATARQDEVGVALRRFALAGVAAVAGILLATPLLLPAIELSQQSVRAAGSLSEQQVRALGVIAPGAFLGDTVRAAGFPTVGVWPLVAVPLALVFAGARPALIATVLVAVFAVSMIVGGPVFELYYRIPVIGSLFRRPMKFLDIYGVAAALLAGFAVSQLDALRGQGASGRSLLPLIVSLALAVAGLVWLQQQGAWSWPLAGVVVVLALFALVPWAPLRAGLVALLCLLQGASLFFEVGDTYTRPVRQPQVFHSRDALWQRLEETLGDARIYVSPRFLFDPSLMPKQGQLRRTAVAIDYEPLAPERYARFFDRVTKTEATAPFAGTYELGPDSQWRLMDLTGTKFFVMRRGEPGDRFMAERPEEFRRVQARPPASVYERTAVLPRAWVVGRARSLPDADAVLDALGDPSFDPRAEVLLEEPLSPSNGGGAIGSAAITSYAPERVVITTQTAAPGFLVLGDLHYPGWRATIDGREVSIQRANYLFRAVRLDQGAHEVRFEYRPASFRLGVWLAALTAAAIAVAAWRTARR